MYVKYSSGKFTVKSEKLIKNYLKPLFVLYIFDCHQAGLDLISLKFTDYVCSYVCLQDEKKLAL